VIHIVQADGVVRVKIELGPNALPVEQLNLKISAHLLISKSIYHSIHLPKIPTVMTSDWCSARGDLLCYNTGERHHGRFEKGGKVL
jgi:hypothetical protein